jgi:hypothetical protein
VDIAIHHRIYIGGLFSMNITINKTRIRPSITIGPNKEHIEKEYGWSHKTKQSFIIDQEVCQLINKHVSLMNDINTLIKHGVTDDPEYDKPVYSQGNKFFKSAFVTAYLDRDHGKALYWLRKAYACFEHDSYIVIEHEHFEQRYIGLFTHVYNDSEWTISAKAVTRSFLGETETYKNIGSIKEEPDLTPLCLRVQQFNKYIEMEHDKRVHCKF